jgi:hypothetical protein
MAVNPIPPQAYTKDTMLRAYSWLQNQSLHIREMATTPDILVSLFLKTTRDGEGALDRPSIQNFKNELRSLAGLMGELESPVQEQVTSPAPAFTSTPTSTPSSTPMKSSNQTQTPSPPFSAQGPLVEAPLPRAQQSSSEVFQSSTTASTRGSGVEEGLGGSLGTAELSISELDPQSLEMIREVKSQLNLSSEREALRVVVRLGHLQVSRLFR